MLVAHGRSAFEQVITSGHPDWAPVAMVSLARLLEKQGDMAGAQNVYQQAIESGHPDSAERASVFLGGMLQ
jgi:TolA-binding protein